MIPALKRLGEAWTAVLVRPGRRPMEALANAVAPMLRTATGTLAGELADHQALIARLGAEPGFLGTVLRSRARREQRKILVFVDQLEELYTLAADPGERTAFTACLAGVADDAAAPLRVMVAIRSDFLDRAAADERFIGDLGRGLFFLAPPGRDGLRDSLVEPARMVGYEFEDVAMVEDMLDHLSATPGALPLLQFTAARLWELRDTERALLTEDSYRRVGGIAGALASHADSVLAEFPAAMLATARALLLRLVTPERTRAVAPVDELHALSRPGDVQRVIDRLVSARLLVVQTGGGAPAVELVHESLIHGWPLLWRWLDESTEDSAFLDQLRGAARQWRARGYPTGLLWRGEAADEARRFGRRYRGELTDVERGYLDAVLAFEARAARRKRAALAATIGLLSALVVAAAVALVYIRDAEQRATEQAGVARGAEARVRAQLEVVRKAKKQAQDSAARAEQARVEKQLTYEELLDKKQEIERALADAEVANQRTRQARKRAEDNAAEARAASERLEAALARERRRRERLEGRLGRWIHGPLPRPEGTAGEESR